MYMYIYVGINMHVCMYVCMYARMHVCMHACMHVCIYVYMSSRTHHAKSRMRKEACWDAGWLALQPPAQVLRLYSSSTKALVRLY